MSALGWGEHTLPAGHRYLDDGIDRECGDEGSQCDQCSAETEAYWAAYFGLRPEMTRQEWRDQLERTRPLGAEGRTGGEAE